MVSHWNYALLVILLTTTRGTATAEQPPTQEQDYGPAVRHAVALLPERPAQVFVLDVNDARPQDREYPSRLQAFIVRGSAVDLSDQARGGSAGGGEGVEAERRRGILGRVRPARRLVGAVGADSRRGRRECRGACYEERAA
jgi:hypothetical protein